MPDTKIHYSPTASGIPPLHTIFFVGLMMTGGILLLPTDLHDVATVDTFTHLEFPDLISLKVMSYIRLGIALLSWSVTFYVVTARGGWVVQTYYKPYSKLRNTNLPLVGLKTQIPFTSWCWMLQGMNNLLGGCVALMASMNKADQIPEWMPTMALITWELSAPFSLLVSAVVRYTIWPAVLKKGVKHNLGGWRNLLQHNLNAVVTLSELCLLGGLPIRLSHLGMHIIFGCVYVVFTWINCYSIVGREKGPQYLYWFLDTTLGATTTIALAVLLSVLVSSFLVLLAMEAGVDTIGQHLAGRVLCVALVSSAVVRTRD